MKNLVLIGILFSAPCFGGIKNDSIIKPQPRSSQLVLSNLLTPDCYMKVTYGQPLKRNRVIFGGLVPFNKLWRTGANEATEMTFTSQIQFGSEVLQAGTYTLFSIPNPDEWTIIVNKKLGQWGDTQYDSTQNVASFKVPVQKTDVVYEGFTIAIENQIGGAVMSLLWDNIRIAIPIKVNPLAIVEKKKKKKRKW